MDTDGVEGIYIKSKLGSEYFGWIHRVLWVLQYEDRISISRLQPCFSGYAVSGTLLFESEQFRDAKHCTAPRSMRISHATLYAYSIHIRVWKVKRSVLLWRSWCCICSDLD